MKCYPRGWRVHLSGLLWYSRSLEDIAFALWGVPSCVSWCACGETEHHVLLCTILYMWRKSTTEEAFKLYRFCFPSPHLGAVSRSGAPGFAPSAGAVSREQAITLVLLCLSPSYVKCPARCLGLR
ncbi:unnamed protein product [Ectocarpus fasciculatus]